MTNLVIRNMVCERCIAAVSRILHQQGIDPLHVVLGEVQFKNAIDAPTQLRLENELIKAGFGIVIDHDARLIARAKAAIIKAVHHGIGKRVELAKLIQQATNKESSTISKLFSEVEGITLEHYYLLQRLERVKELIRYDELSFSEIAFATGFSSVAHLSGQFKKLTGMTPSAFKKAHGQRSALDKVG